MIERGYTKYQGGRVVFHMTGTKYQGGRVIFHMTGTKREHLELFAKIKFPYKDYECYVCEDVKDINVDNLDQLEDFNIITIKRINNE